MRLDLALDAVLHHVYTQGRQLRGYGLGFSARLSANLDYYLC